MSINFDLEYVKSSYIQSVVDGDNAVIWHSLFGNPKVVSVETLEFLELFQRPTSISSIFDSTLDSEETSAINELVNSYFLVSHDFDDREYLKRRMEEREVALVNNSQICYLELIMSELCNFRCTYCIHFNNLEIHDRLVDSDKFMNIDTAKKSIDKYLQILTSNNNNVAEINFGGGEPLMAWDVIEKILTYCDENYAQDFHFVYSINTNASLIDSRIAKILKKYNFSIATSLDGLRDENNKVRITKQGMGTFEQIINGFDELSKVNYPIDGFAATINAENFYAIDETLIDWAVERGMKNVRLDIDILGTANIPINEVVSKFLKIRRYASMKNIEIPGFWLRPTENLNESTIEKHIAFCGATRGNSMCVNPSGKIFSCGYSSEEIGSIYNYGSNSFPEKKYIDFVKRNFTGNKELCRDCMIEGQCNGGCNITIEFSSKNESSNIDRMCEFYRRITKEILLEQLHKTIT